MLAGEIGRDSIHSLGGSVIIAHRSTGTILGTIIGTAYMLRMAPPLHDELHQADVSSTKTWSDGRTTDLFTDVGPDWIWGSWHNDEARWLAETLSYYYKTERSRRGHARSEGFVTGCLSGGG